MRTMYRSRGRISGDKDVVNVLLIGSDSEIRMRNWDGQTP